MLQETVTFIKDHWVFVIVSLIATRLLSNYFQQRLHRIPGPWLRTISSIPRVVSVYKNISQDDDIALHKKYGKIVRLAPNLLSIADPAEIN